MIDLATLSVRDLLPAKLDTLDSVVADRLKDAADDGGPRIPKFLSGAIADTVAAALTGILDIRLLPVLADAWAKADEIRRHAVPDAHPANPTVLFLGEHSLSATIHPAVTLSFSGAPVLEIPFTIAITVTVHAVQITIRGGYLTAIGRSTGSIAAQVRIGEVPLHRKLRSRDYQLLGDHTLPTPGLSLLPLA